MDVEIEHNEPSVWTGRVGGKVVATFEYTEDHYGRMWLFLANTVDGWQRKGIGMKMVAAAVDEYEAVWISTAMRWEEGGSDARHLSEAGAALVNACIREGILKSEWCGNPYTGVGFGAAGAE